MSKGLKWFTKSGYSKRVFSEPIFKVFWHKRLLFIQSYIESGVVRCGEGLVYRTSLGHPTDTGLQLGKYCCLIAGKSREEMFLFLLFFHFHSCSSFFSVPLFYLLYYLFRLFTPFSGKRHKMTHKG